MDYQPLPTRNPVYGFYGTMECCGHDPKAAWNAASHILAERAGAKDDYGPEGVRDFLDSRAGRHFADTVVSLLNRRHEQGMTLHSAIQAATEEWMGMRTGRREEAEHDIPRGLPYATGMIMYHAIQAAMADEATTG